MVPKGIPTIQLKNWRSEVLYHLQYLRTTCRSVCYLTLILSSSFGIHQSPLNHPPEGTPNPPYTVYRLNSDFQMWLHFISAVANGLRKCDLFLYQPLIFRCQRTTTRRTNASFFSHNLVWQNQLVFPLETIGDQSKRMSQEQPALRYSHFRF